MILKFVNENNRSIPNAKVKVFKNNSAVGEGTADEKGYCKFSIDFELPVNVEVKVAPNTWTPEEEITLNFDMTEGDQDKIQLLVNFKDFNECKLLNPKGELKKSKIEEKVEEKVLDLTEDEIKNRELQDPSVPKHPTNGGVDNEPTATPGTQQTESPSTIVPSGT